MKNAHQMSLVYEYLIKSTLVKLEDVSRELTEFEHNSKIKKIMNTIQIQKIKKHYLPNKICPICNVISERVAGWIGNLLNGLMDEEIKQLYFESYGLCMNHFSQAIESATPEAAELMIQKQVEVLKKLNGDLEEYSRKLDYRYSHEPMGEEQTAWIRATKFFVGKEL
jgi:hypothetical protein